MYKETAVKDTAFRRTQCACFLAGIFLTPYDISQTNTGKDIMKSLSHLGKTNKILSTFNHVHGKSRNLQDISELH